MLIARLECLSATHWTATIRFSGIKKQLRRQRIAYLYCFLNVKIRLKTPDSSRTARIETFGVMFHCP